MDNTVWTETPAEKHQRLADEAAGIKRNKVPKKGEKDEGYEARGKRQREEEIRQEVERHTVSLLLKQHDNVHWTDCSEIVEG